MALVSFDVYWHIIYANETKEGGYIRYALDPSLALYCPPLRPMRTSLMTGLIIATTESMNK